MSTISRIPEEGLDQYEVSLTIKTLLEINQSLSTGGKQHCTYCKDNNLSNIDAVSRCMECNEYFCKNCEQSHNRFLRGHTVLDLTGDREQDMQNALNVVKQRTMYCDIHKTNPLELYCKKCNCVICHTCYVIKHTHHSCTDINQAADDNEKLIDELLQKGETLVENYKKSIQDTHMDKERMEKEADDATQQLNKNMNLAIQAVRAKFTKNINLVAENKETCSKQAMAHINHLNMQKAFTEIQVNQLRLVKQHGHKIQLINMAKEIETRKEKWTHTPIFEDNIIIRVEKGDIDADKAVFDKVNIYKVQQPADTKVLEKDLKRRNVNSYSYGGQVLGLASMSENGIAVIDGDITSIYTENLEHRVKVGDKYLGVAAKGANELLLTNQTDKIHIHSFRQIHIPELKKCRGIAVNSKGELVISDLVTRTIYHVDATTGKILTKFKPYLFQNPSWVAVNSKDIVIVSDSNGCCVVGLTRDGNEVFRYEGGKLGSPMGICVDKADNILVADYSNNLVHQLNPDGQLLRCISDGEQTYQTYCQSVFGQQVYQQERRFSSRPCSVAVNNQGKLFVGFSHGSVWSIKYME